MPATGDVTPPGSVTCEDRCGADGVAYFHKQWGGRTPKAGGRMLDGRTWDELPRVGKSQEHTLPLW